MTTSYNGRMREDWNLPYLMQNEALGIVEGLSFVYNASIIPTFLWLPEATVVASARVDDPSDPCTDTLPVFVAHDPSHPFLWRKTPRDCFSCPIAPAEPWPGPCADVRPGESNWAKCGGTLPSG